MLRPFRTYRRYILTVGLAVVVLVGIGIFSTHQKLLAATYTWVQSAWTGGATANTGVHPTNETGWTEYSAKDTTIAAGASVALSAATQTVTDTSDTDFNAGAQSSTGVSGTGAGAQEQLSISEGSTPAFTQYANVGSFYEMDTSTNSVWVSGLGTLLTKYNADGSSTTALATINLSAYDNSSGVVPLAYDSTLGVLWALGRTTANLNLIKINVSTASVISSTTIETDASSVKDIRYDVANDVLWVAYSWGSGNRLLKVNKSGTVLQTIATNVVAEMAVDPGTSSIWYVDGTNNAYKQPESGAAATQIGMGGGVGNTKHIIYESATPAIWTTSEQFSFSGYSRILTSNNSVTTKTDAELTDGIAYDSVHDVLWAIDSFSAKVFKISRTSPGVLATYTPSNTSASSRIMYDSNARALWFNNSGTGLTKRMTFVSYAASGNFTSRIIDTTANTAFGNASWNITTPTNTTAVVKIRSSNSATMSGAPAFSSCSAITSGQNPTVGGCVTNGHRYVQYNVAFTTTNTAVTPTLQDLSLTYTNYTNGTLTSSSYDTQDANNVVAKIEWVSSGTGTVKFQIRTSPDNAAWTSWLGPTNGSDYYTDNTGGQAINTVNHDTSGDRYVQYKAYLISADGVTTPTLSSITLTYVVNAPPEFQAAPTAVQNADGTVTISYSVRDTDTSTDTGSVGVVTPSFEYSIDNGAHWSAISSGLPGSATTTKVVNASTYTPYTAIWTAKTTLNGTYAAQTKIRVTVTDQQAANATAVGTSTAFALDVKNPALGVTPILIDASTIPAQLTLNASDDTPLQMCLSLDNTQTNCTSYAASSTITLETDPDTVYAIYRDGFGNTASASVVTPTTPNNLVIRDISNQTTSEYQLFLTWAATSLPSNQFSKYEVYHSTTGLAGSYVLLGNIADKTINYYLHKALVAGTTHYYRISTVDANGNESYLSVPINAVANGQGGGTDVVPPTISNVSVSSISTQSAVVTWDTDELSNSTVGYSATAAHFDTEVGVATMVDHAGGVGRHSVVMTGLTPSTPYYLRIKSADPGGNTATDTNGGDGYTFSTLAGPTISTVTTSSIDNTTATITWVTNSAANSSVVYSTSPTLATPTTITSATSVTQHSVTLSGLTLATKYYFQVQSGVAIDTNAGQYYSFTTTHDSSAPVITNITVAPITDTQAVVSWSTDEKSTSQVAYGLSPGSHPTQTAYDSNLNIEHTVTISNLTAHTMYYFVVSSTDASANPAISSEQSFQTLYQLDQQIPGVTPPAISAISVNPILDTQAVIQWTTDNPSTSRVDYGTSHGVYPAHVGPDVTLNVKHYSSLTGLTAHTTYYYTVTSVDKWGNSATSAEQTFITQYALVQQTPTVTPPVIANITADPITDTGMVIHWVTDTSSKSQVAFGTTPGSHPNSTTLVATLDINHAVILSGLTANTAYYYVVISTDQWGNTATSPEQVATTKYQLAEQTPLVVPPTLSLISASPVTDTQAVVQWSTNTAATSRVDYGTSAGNRTQHGGPNGQLTIHHALTLPGLTAHTTYYYTVTSTDTWGNTATSAEQTFTTQYELIEQTPLTTPPVLSAISTEPVADTTAVMHWISDVPATSQVSYGVTTNSYSTATAIDASLNLNHVQTLSSLLPNTKYFYVVTSTDRWGNSTTSTEQSFTTSDTLLTSSQVQSMIDAIQNQNKPDTTPPTVTGVAVQNLSSSSVDITWNTDEPANSFVQFNSTADDQLVYGNWVYEKTHTITLRNLVPKTTYTYHVVSADLQGNVTTSAGATIDTPALSTGTLETQINNQLQNLQQEAQAIPGPVIGGQPKVEVTANSATISWSTDKGANSLISYSTDAEFSKQQAYTQTVGDPDHFLLVHSVKMSNLSENTLYHYQIKSSTQVGQKSTTPDATFQTTKKSFAIDNYSVDTPGAQSAVFRWTTNDVSTALVQATPYRNNVLAVDEMMTQNDSTKALIHQVSISTFEPGTKYKVEMVSTSTNGNRTSKTIDAFSTSVNGQPPAISQIHVDSALSPGDKVKVQSIISWTTDIPSTSQVQYGPGVGKADAVLPNSSPLDGSYSKHHVVVITAFDPGTVYQLRVESKSSTGLTATSKAITTLTPQQEQTVFQVITDTFQQVFGWVKIFGK